MSGIGFQKLQGAGTAAYAQLQKTNDLIDGISKLNQTDLFKTAVEFNPNKTLTPIVKQWQIERRSDTFKLQFDGTFFGRFTISLSQFSLPDQDNVISRSNASLFNGDTKVIDTMTFTQGRTNAFVNIPFDFIGFATALQSEADNASSVIICSFIGYKVTDAVVVPLVVVPPFVPPVIVPPVIYPLCKVFFSSAVDYGDSSIDVISRTSNGVVNTQSNDSSAVTNPTTFDIIAGNSYYLRNNLTKSIDLTVNGVLTTLLPGVIWFLSNPQAQFEYNVTMSPVAAPVYTPPARQLDPFYLILGKNSPYVGEFLLYDDINPDVPFYIATNDTPNNFNVFPTLGFNTITVVNNTDQQVWAMLRSDYHYEAAIGETKIYQKSEFGYPFCIVGTVLT